MALRPAGSVPDGWNWSTRERRYWDKGCCVLSGWWRLSIPHWAGGQDGARDSRAFIRSTGKEGHCGRGLERREECQRLRRWKPQLLETALRKGMELEWGWKKTGGKKLIEGNSVISWPHEPPRERTNVGTWWKAAEPRAHTDPSSPAPPLDAGWLWAGC